MSSYLSQPKQFTPYTPEYDSGLYSGMLQQHEQKYQEGIQRVEANREAIASLPILNDADRQYTNQKLAGITTELNQQMGADWSDQGIQRLTNKHITAIASDPVVQNAVSQTAYATKEYRKAKQGYNDTDGADVANQYNFNKSYSSYLSNPNVGAKFDGQYHPYVDDSKLVRENIGKMHPDWEEVQTPATDKWQTDPVTGKKTFVPAYRQWSLTTKTYEGIPQAKVKATLDLIVNNHPELTTQLNLNAQYQMKDLSNEHIVRQQLENSRKNIEINNNVKQHLLEQKLGVANLTPEQLRGNTPEQVTSFLQGKIDGIDKENESYNNYLNDGYKTDYMALQSPAFREQYNNTVYKNSWMNEKILEYSWDKKSTKFEGDPFSKTMQFEAGKRADQAHMDEQYWKKVDDDFRKAKYANDNEQWMLDYKAKYGTTPGGIPPVTLSTDANLKENLLPKFDEKLITDKGAITNNAIKFLYNSMDADRDKYFNVTYDDQHNQIITPKPADATGFNPTKELFGVDNLKDWEGKGHGGVIDAYLQTIGVGQKDQDGQKLKLTNAQKVSLASLNDNIDLYQNARNYRKSLDDQFSKSGHDIIGESLKHIDATIDNINRVYHTNIGKQDIHEFMDKVGSDPELLTLLKQASNPDDNQWRPAVHQGETKYGQEQFDKMFKIYSVEGIHNIVDPSEKILAERNKFYGDRLYNSGVVPVEMSTPILTGNVEANKNLKNRIQAKIKNLPPGVVSDQSLVDKVLTGTEPGENIAYYRDSKEQLHLQFITKGDKAPADILITNPEDIADIVPSRTRPVDDPLVQLIRYSDAKTTVPKGENRSWTNARIIGIDKNGVTHKAHIFHNDDGYHYIPYVGTDIINAKEGTDSPLGENLDNVGQLIKAKRLEYKSK
jgi:hypothetical protein